MDPKALVNWTFSALEMLAEIHDYLGAISEPIADKYVGDLVGHVAKKLEKHPESCAPCRNPKLSVLGYRCCNFKNHIIIYEIENEVVNILAVMHTKRNPKDLEDLG
ncbi:MAG: type II toxin-antitoxin system RelE/ParE family toxin [Saprospirales bacterium]|nr:type II toxin-antitoxin system RelE/ParE family toxin [Saprospirales bacterium]